SADGAFLIVAGFDGWRIHDPISGKPRSTEGAHLFVTSVSFGPDRRTVALAQYGGVSLWNAHTGEHRSLEGIGSDPSRKVSWSSDGRFLASCTGDTEIRLFDFVAGAWRVLTVPEERSVFNIAFSPDGKMLAAAGINHVWLAEMPAEQMRKLEGSVSGIAFP